MTPESAYTKQWRETPSGRASVERYAASEKGRATRRRAQAAYKARNLAKAREHNRILQRVRNAVARGQLLKTACVECGAEKVQAHHHNGYAPEHELDVTWLCAKHHAVAHGRSH